MARRNYKTKRNVVPLKKGKKKKRDYKRGISSYSDQEKMFGY